jgi:HlyD family secretion protein
VTEFRTGNKKGKGAGAAAQGKPAADKEEQARGVIWVPQGSQVRPIKVKLGLSDGSLTEVASAGLKEGTPIVVGEAEKAAAEGGRGGSPFTPQLFRKPANGK